MKKKVLCICLLLLISFFPALSEEPASMFSLRLTPGLNIPLGRDTDLVRLGGGGFVSGEMRMPFLPVLYAGVDIGYNYLPLYTDTNLSLLAFGAGTGFDIPLMPWMNLRVFGRGGYFYGLLHDASEKGGNPFVSGG